MAARTVEGPDQPWMTLQQVAGWLSLSESSVRRLIKIGRFPPPVELGGGPRWEWLDCVAFAHLAKRCQEDFGLSGPVRDRQGLSGPVKVREPKKGE